MRLIKASERSEVDSFKIVTSTSFLSPLLANSATPSIQSETSREDGTKTLGKSKSFCAGPMSALSCSSILSATKLPPGMCTTKSTDQSSQGSRDSRCGGRKDDESRTTKA